MSGLPDRPAGRLQCIRFAPVADRLVPLAGQGRNLGRVLLGRSEKRGGACEKFSYVHSTYRLKRRMRRLIYCARLRFRLCVRVIPAGSPSFFRT